MLVLSLIRHLDRHWLAALGLLGACGPLSPAENATDSSSGGTTTGETTAPTSGTTSEPPECYYGGCCDENCCYYAAPGGGTWRCGPGYECNSNDDCMDGYVCDFESCVPGPPPLLPSCEPGLADVSQWALTGHPSGFGLADLDGDADLDVFAVLPDVAALELAFNDGAGAFTPGGVVDLGLPQLGMRVAGGDLDGDGEVDLAVARADSSDLVVLFGQDGVFMPGPTLPASVSPQTITVADLDGDGDRDLVTFGGGLGVVSAWVGDGVGGFAPEKIVLEIVDSNAANIQHVDADSAADLLTLPVQRAPLVMHVYRGTAEATLAPPQTFELEEPWWKHALAGDLGGSPARELVATRGGGLGVGAVVRVWGGIDDATWAAPVDASTASRLEGGVLADSNGDSFLDLVAATGSGAVSLLHGDGQGGFSCEQIVEVDVAIWPELLAAGDLDGDGRAEMVVGSREYPMMMVIRPL